MATEDADLHAGPDLSNALERSVLVSNPSTVDRRFALPGRMRQVIDDALHAPVLKVVPSTVLVTGMERRSGEPMRVLFRGQLRAVDFCAQHIFGTSEVVRAPARPRDAESCDIAVFDHPLVGGDWLGSRASLNVPLWIGQRSKLDDTWPGTLESLPQDLTKEIARLLRKHGFTVTTTARTSAKMDFYERIYAPFIRQRFGSLANVRDERTFVRESREALLVQLFLGGALTGATLVKRRSDALLVDKTGLALEHDVPGRSIVLDYFCFLVAQIARCRWVDFGVSRPHLDDGVFRYKCKWRTELVPAGGLKPTIRIRPLKRSRPTLEFLSRNGFIERRGGRFIVRRLLAEPPTGEELDAMDALAVRSGIDAMTVALAGAAAETESRNPGGQRTKITALPDSPALLRAFLELP